MTALERIDEVRLRAERAEAKARLADRDRRLAEARPVIVKAPDREPFFTPKTLAQLLQVSERTVRTMLAEHRIASYRVMGQRRVSAEDLRVFLDRNRDEQRR